MTSRQSRAAPARDCLESRLARVIASGLGTTRTAVVGLAGSGAVHEPTTRLVTPFHLDVLHGNLLAASPDAHGATEHAMRAAARTIGPSELADLLPHGWREALMAAWWAAVVDERALLRPLGERLLASEMPFASQSATVALARFGADGDTDAVDYLADYLDLYLERPDLAFDQGWALGALIVTDRARTNSRATPYTAPGGPWDRWLAGQAREGTAPVSGGSAPEDGPAKWSTRVSALVEIARSLDPRA